MPLSVYCGRADVMDKLDTAIVSTTYGGETLSLAAAKATMEIYQKQNVVKHLWDIGTLFWDGFRALFKKHNLPFDIVGLPPISILTTAEDADPELRTRLLRNIYKNGVCLYNGGYINFSHKESDIKEALTRIEKAIKEL
jgi:glutamate-1-semialdehyde 2,1-aminomutase